MKAKEVKKDTLIIGFEEKKIECPKCNNGRLLKYYDSTIKTKDELPGRYTCDICKAKPMYTGAGTYYCLDSNFYECLNCAGHFIVEDNPICLICKEELQILDQASIKRKIQEKLQCIRCKVMINAEQLKDTTETVTNFHLCKCKNQTFCQKCHEDQKETKSKCDKGHEKNLYEFSPAFGNIRDTYKCDICDESNFSSIYERYACYNCIYNICRRCKPIPSKNFKYYKECIDNKFSIPIECEDYRIAEENKSKNKNNEKKDSEKKSEKSQKEEEKKEEKKQIIYYHPWIWGEKKIKSKNEILNKYDCANCGLGNLECSAKRMECPKCKINICWFCMGKTLQKNQLKKIFTCMRNHELIEDSEVPIDELFEKFRCPKCKKNPGNYFGIFKPKTEECSECKDYSLVTIPDSIKDVVFRCSLCYAYPVSAKNVSFQCLDCQFHICNTCKIPGSVAEIEKCPSGHPLTFSIEDAKENRSIDCTKCAKKILNPKNGYHICDGNDYILCSSCKLPDLQKAFKHTVHKCIKDPKHTLSFITQDKAKINQDIKKYGERCNQCNEEIDLSESIYACSLCSDYFVCQKCIILAEFLTEENPKCPNKDEGNLKLTYDNFGFDARFFCNICLLPNECAKGRRRCEKCNFSICPQCLSLPDFQLCSICLKYKLKPAKQPNCHHDFKRCRDCIKDYKDNASCPICPPPEEKKV